jgi:hypothetical protein
MISEHCFTVLSAEPHVIRWSTMHFTRENMPNVIFAHSLFLLPYISTATRVAS